MCVPWESNPQPLRCLRNALTTEPQEHVKAQRDHCLSAASKAGMLMTAHIKRMQEWSVRLVRHLLDHTEMTVLARENGFRPCNTILPN